MRVPSRCARTAPEISPWVRPRRRAFSVSIAGRSTGTCSRQSSLTATAPASIMTCFACADNWRNTTGSGPKKRASTIDPPPGPSMNFQTLELAWGMFS